MKNWFRVGDIIKYIDSGVVEYLYSQVTKIECGNYFIRTFWIDNHFNLDNGRIYDFRKYELYTDTFTEDR